MPSDSFHLADIVQFLPDDAEAIPQRIRGRIEAVSGKLRDDSVDSKMEPVGTGWLIFTREANSQKTTCQQNCIETCTE